MQTLIIVVSLVGTRTVHAVFHGAGEPIIPVLCVLAHSVQAGLAGEVVILERRAVGHEDHKQITLFRLDGFAQLIHRVKGIVIVRAGAVGQRILFVGGTGIASCIEGIFSQLMDIHESVRIQLLGASVYLCVTNGGTDKVTVCGIGRIVIIGTVGIREVSVEIGDSNADIQRLAVFAVCLQRIQQVVQGLGQNL